MDGATAVWFKQFVWLFFLPPNGLLTLAFGAALFAVWRPGSQRLPAATTAASLALLYFLMTPAISHLLMDYVESGVGEALTPERARELMQSSLPPDAIVVLAGGLFYDTRNQPEAAMPTGHSLMRLMHAGQLARWTGLSILVSGGVPDGQNVSEAGVMARVLRQRLDQPVQWIEDKSFDTADNARLSARALGEVGISRIILVTEAFHMVRARAAFEAQGLQVVSAPLAFRAGRGVALDNTWLPGPLSIERTTLAFHEIVGRWWYRIGQWWRQLPFNQRKEQQP